LRASEKIASILRWSALPGTSRHHWGTDLDIIDAKALTAEMKVQRYLPSLIFLFLKFFLSRLISVELKPA